MPSILRTATTLATKSAGTAFQVGSFVLGRAFHRLQSLTGQRSEGDTYTPVTPQSPQLKALADPAAKPVAVPSTRQTTSTAPGPATKSGRSTPATTRKPTPARPTPTAAKPAAPVKSTPRKSPTPGARISNPKAAKAVRKREAAASLKGTETSGATPKVGATETDTK